jgi:Amt family ammonium transporter
VAGLVAITPACAFVAPVGAIWIGAGSAVVCYVAVALVKPALGYDDSLDVFGVHGIGGTWGALATGLFIADFAMPEGVTWGQQVLKQVTSIGITAVFAPAMTIVILLVMRAVMGDLRVDEESESGGLDLSEHSETAYSSD